MPWKPRARPVTFSNQQDNLYSFEIFSAEIIYGFWGYTCRLSSYRKKVRKVDVRLPITRAILHKLIHSSSQFSDSDFSKVRFNAMCTLAFHAFLRVGEMTLASPGAPPPIQLRQLTRLTNSNGYCVALKLTFTDFKHNYNKRPFSLVINRENQCCPVESEYRYSNGSLAV